MKMRISLWNRVPVKFRACWNLLAIGLCLVLIYICMGSPVLTVRGAYRRAEKANLVGPGEILAVLEPEGQTYSRLVLAQEETGVMLYAWDRWNAEAREFVYLAKEDPLTIAAAPGQELLWTQTQATLPVYLFDDCPDAVRAELELTIQGEYEAEPYTKIYPLTAAREGDGYFAFCIHTNSSGGSEGHSLAQLRNVTGNSMADTAGTVIRAAVRPYDTAGDLLVDTEMELHSAAFKAQKK